jgi:hypothetical protein
MARSAEGEFALAGLSAAAAPTTSNQRTRPI